MEDLSKIIKAALVPSHSAGGRILITTKSEGIANYWKKSSSHGETYNVKALSEKYAETLFDKKAFGINQGQCPWKLASLKDKIVQECDGLPFLIEEVGSIFSTTQKWIELYSNFQVNHLSSRSKRIFMSSYYDMPHHLKPCFLYLCMFPKACKLERMRIVRLWIAEGFVEAKHHSTLEEAAEEYLNELVQRGMVHFSEVDETGRSRKFRLPNMWHHLMLPKLADLSFCQVLPETIFSTNNRCRRLSVHSDIEDTFIPPSVRSILSFVQPERFPITWPSPYDEAPFRLKVLDLQNAKFTAIPDTIRNLHNLRYLCLRNTPVKKLPESISGLWNLQTLDLKQTEVTELPRGINRLHELRHLLMGRYDEDMKKVPVKIHEGVLEKLLVLQKLSFVDGMLTMLRRLGIGNVEESGAQNFCKALKQMKWLRSLSIFNEGDQGLDLSHLNNKSAESPLEYLERLYLQGKLKDGKLPEWVRKCKHLVRVRLMNSQLTEDPLNKLRVMHELLVLELDNTYHANALDFGYGGFKNLRVLRLQNLHYLETLKIGKKALPSLEKARYRNCPNFMDLSQIPPRIKEVLERIESNNTLRKTVHTN